MNPMNTSTLAFVALAALIGMAAVPVASASALAADSDTSSMKVCVPASNICVYRICTGVTSICIFCDASEPCMMRE